MDFLVQSAHALVHLGSWITTHKEVLGVVVGGSGIVSLVLEPVKKWLSIQSHSVITVLHYALALAAVAVHYIATSASQNPIVLFTQALVVLGTNQFVYPLFTKPLSGMLSDAKTQASASKLTAEAEQLANVFKD